MKEKRISNTIEEILNKQIANEMNSSKLYRAMSNCLEYSGWVGAAKLWKKYAEEENMHAEKIIEYMQDRDCKPQIPLTMQPPKDFDGLKVIVTKSDEHEKKISSDWKEIAKLSLKEFDLMTFELAQWFIKEQQEEEMKMIYWIDRIAVLESTNTPLYFIDKEMEEKV